jgi:hypothetical protein
VAGDPGVLDPFGEGGENDQLAANLVDGDPSTEWATETYLDPLPLLKPGVGVTMEITGTPDRVELVDLTAGTRFEIRWSSDLLSDPDAWELIAGATASPSSTSVELPPRNDGFWLVWLLDLPPQGDGTYRATMAELRFLP